MQSRNTMCGARNTICANKNKEMAKRDLDKAVELGYNRAALTEMYKRLRKLGKR